MPVAQSQDHYINSSKGCPSIRESFPLCCFLLHKMSLLPLWRHCQWRFSIAQHWWIPQGCCWMWRPEYFNVSTIDSVCGKYGPDARKVLLCLASRVVIYTDLTDVGAYFVSASKHKQYDYFTLTKIFPAFMTQMDTVPYQREKLINHVTTFVNI
jgi:hypothetical protein